LIDIVNLITNFLTVDRNCRETQLEIIYIQTMYSSILFNYVHLARNWKKNKTKRDSNTIAQYINMKNAQYNKI